MGKLRMWRQCMQYNPFCYPYAFFTNAQLLLLAAVVVFYCDEKIVNVRQTLLK
jgi:hypothetical protein